MRILLLSAYHAESHHYWASGLIENLAKHDFTLLTLPARYFSWRVRGNSLSWAYENRETLEADYDLLLCTSMTDLSALRGLVPALAKLPSIVYFHENQFAYPTTGKQQGLVEAQLTSIYTALSADRVLFNSDWNRRSFLDGAVKLLKKMPDHCPTADLVSTLESKSSQLPVPLKPIPALPDHPENTRLQLLWNHRWEYDKGPEILLETAKACDAMQLPIDWHIVGQQFRKQPAEFEQIKSLLDDSTTQHIAHWGYVDSYESYLEVMNLSDVVLSTSLHDFQGLAILEAVQAGCLPLLPNRLCYNEWFDDDYLLDDNPPRAEAEGRLNAKRLNHYITERPAVPSVKNLSWAALASEYEDVLASTAQAAKLAQ